MNKEKSFAFFSQSGCLLPVLIILNLFFGWIFFRPPAWLLLEAILILLFLFNGYILTRKIFSQNLRRDDAIDVKGEVVEDKKENVD
jgi:hypothetical protein